MAERAGPLQLVRADTLWSHRSDATLANVGLSRD